MLAETHSNSDDVTRLGQTKRCHTWSMGVWPFGMKYQFSAGTNPRILTLNGNSDTRPACIHVYDQFHLDNTLICQMWVPVM